MPFLSYSIAASVFVCKVFQSCNTLQCFKSLSGCPDDFLDLAFLNHKPIAVIFIRTLIFHIEISATAVYFQHGNLSVKDILTFFLLHAIISFDESFRLMCEDACGPPSPRDASPLEFGVS